MRVRSISKVGKGKYVTSSYKFSEYLILNIIMWIFLFPFLIIYWMCKYFIYKPIVSLINKFKQK